MYIMCIYVLHMDIVCYVNTNVLYIKLSERNILNYTHFIKFTDNSDVILHSQNL